MVFISGAVLGSIPDGSVIFQVDHGQIIFDNKTVESATIINGHEIYLKLKTITATKFGDITQKDTGKRAEIFLNGEVISSTTIRSKLGGEFIITGLTKKQALAFVQSLKLDRNLKSNKSRTSYNQK